MEIHQFEYVVAIVETGNFSKAAVRCNIAQPSLSQQIIKLEQELGFALFDRLGRKVVLTDRGRDFLKHAYKILAEIQEIKINKTSFEIEKRGLIKVGFIPTIAPFVLPTVIMKFSEQFPDANLEVYEGLTDELVDKIVDASLDVAITSLPIKNDLIQTEELLTEPLFLASTKNFNILTHTTLNVKELNQFPFIALSEVHCLGEQIQSFCAQENLLLKVVCHTAQLSTVQNCIKLGLGVSLVPYAMVVTNPSEKIDYRLISDHIPHRKIAAAMHKKKAPSFLVTQFINMVKQEYPQYTGQLQYLA